MSDKMRIIMAVPYIYAPEIQNGNRNRSGLAYMIRSIAEEIAKGAKLSVLTQSYFVNQDTEINGFVMRQKRIFDLLRSPKKILYLRLGFQVIKKQRINCFKEKLKVLYYFLDGAYLEKLITMDKVDRVFIHGTIDLYTLPFVLACERKQVGVLHTFHGLVSLEQEVTRVSDFIAKLEKKYIENAYNHRVPLTMISTGMKFRMEKELNVTLDNTRIISNFCGVDVEVAAKKHREGNNYDEKTNVLIIGSVSVRKQQMFAVKAYELLSEELRKKHKLFIIGDGPEKNEVEKYIINNKVENVILRGDLMHEELFEEYKNARLIIMTSRSEGFGLPILEGYWFGIPAVMFSDVDAFLDLNNENVCIGVDERSHVAFAKGMQQALEKSWNSNKIREFALDFSKEKIGREYIEALNNMNQPFPEGFYNELLQD